MQEINKKQIKLQCLDFQQIKHGSDQRLLKSPEKSNEKKPFQSLDISPVLDRVKPRLTLRPTNQKYLVIQNHQLQAENRQNKIIMRRLMDIIERQKIGERQMTQQKSRGTYHSKASKQKFKSQPDLSQDDELDTFKIQQMHRQNISANDISLIEQQNNSQFLPQVYQNKHYSAHKYNSQYATIDQMEQTFGPKDQLNIFRRQQRFPKEVFQGNVSKVKRQFQNYYS